MKRNNLSLFNNIIRKVKENLLPIALATLVIVAWELASRFGIVDTTYFGKPSNIVFSLYKLFADKEIYTHIFYSLRTFFIGFGLALTVGLGLGILVGYSRKLYKLFSPYIFILQVIPKIILLPLLIIWFGIGLNTRVALVFVMAVIPVVLTTINAVRNIDPKLLEMGRSFEGRRFFLLEKIVFFASLKEVFSGVRLGIGRATSGMIISEYFGINKGLGALISLYGASYKTDKLFAVIILIVIWNMIMLKSVDILSNKVRNY